MELSYPVAALMMKIGNPGLRICLELKMTTLKSLDARTLKINVFSGSVSVSIVVRR